jgi:predicted transcriptional regulator of viral defense system
MAWDKTLAQLPAVFTYTDAMASGLTARELYSLRDQGVIELLARGTYSRARQTHDADLLEILRRAPDATLCLTSALAHHRLTDQIPHTIDVAIPRGRRKPVTAAPATWHLFDPTTFEIDRDEMRIDANSSIGIYGAKRCIIDAFRLRHLHGNDLAISALKQWLRLRGSNPADLLRMTRRFPIAETAIRQTLEILL